MKKEKENVVITLIHTIDGITLFMRHNCSLLFFFFFFSLSHITEVADCNYQFIEVKDEQILLFSFVSDLNVLATISCSDKSHSSFKTFVYSNLSVKSTIFHPEVNPPAQKEKN